MSFTLVDNLVTLYRAQLTDPNLSRSAKSQEWIHWDFPRRDATEWPRVGVFILDTPFEPMHLGTQEYKTSILVRHAIITDKKAKARSSTSVNITAITKASPAQVTAVSHGRSTGDIVYLDSIVGMTELNDSNWSVTRVDDDNLTLDLSDSTDYTAYTSGGKVYQFEIPAAETAHTIREAIRAILGDSTHIATIKGWGFERPIIRSVKPYNDKSRLGELMDVRIMEFGV